VQEGLTTGHVRAA